MDHSLVSGCIRVIYRSLIYVQLKTRGLHVSLDLVISRERAKIRLRGHQYHDSLGDIPAFTWKAVLCSGKGSPGEETLSNGPASGTILLCDLGPVAFPLWIPKSSFVKGRGCSRWSLRFLSSPPISWFMTAWRIPNHDCYGSRIGRMALWARSTLLRTGGPGALNAFQSPGVENESHWPFSTSPWLVRKQPSERPRDSYFRIKITSIL